jgi:hypothetical protein
MFAFGLNKTMKSEDQLLLEEAYQDVLLNELNWKGALAAGAMALGGVACKEDGTCSKGQEPAPIEAKAASGSSFASKLGPRDEFLKKKHAAFSKMVASNPSHTIDSITVTEYLKRMEKLNPQQIQKIRAAEMVGNGGDFLDKYIQPNKR